MSKTAKKIIGAFLAVVISGGALCQCTASTKEQKSTVEATDNKEWNGKTPKYIFMFIGDGMSYPQIQATQYYNGVKANGVINAEEGKYPTL